MAVLLCLPLVSFGKNEPVIAIIIDDIGDNLDKGLEIIDLPGEITLSILPLKSYSRVLAETAHMNNREIMLHMPMQPMSANKHMGPGGLKLNMSHKQLAQTFRTSLQSVPYVSGVNNHMGSLLTANARPMKWLMAEIDEIGGLYFVDSRTHHSSVAAFMASEYNLSNASRDIFLDDDINKEKIELYFSKLILKAKKTGFALAIGHPHRETLDVLAEWLPKLESLGVQLVPVSKYIQRKQQRGRIWQASLSRSPLGAKN
ncbi:MAG: divergent polysaccharide deacetylase family protein [Gammaproteobacteria bacterium]|nr:divergent polysaccharide deacetylase family protein [Gammaproteobacteria bacterium]